MSLTSVNSVCPSGSVMSVSATKYVFVLVLNRCASTMELSTSLSSWAFTLMVMLLAAVVSSVYRLTFSTGGPIT